MPYSTDEDLSSLIGAEAVGFQWSFSGVTFFGTGPNDMTINPIQGTTNVDIARECVVRVHSIAPGSYDNVRFSTDNGASFSAATPIPTELVFPLNYGINALFGIRLGHNIGDYWKFTATPIPLANLRDMAYDWLNENLERTHDVPFAAPSKTVVLTEATYTIYLMLRRDNDPRYAEFYVEAQRLLNLLMGFRAAAEIPAPAGV